MPTFVVPMRVKLLTPALEHAKRLAVHANNPRVAQFMRERFPSPYSVEDATNFINYLNSPNCCEKAFVIAVPTDEDDDNSPEDTVGIISLVMQSDIHRHSAELGFWIGEQYWGKGIGSAAVIELLDNLKSYVPMTGDVPLRRIYAFSHAENIGSARVLAKSGFEREGFLRDYAFKNGEFSDGILYARIIE